MFQFWGRNLQIFNPIWLLRKTSVKHWAFLIYLLLGCYRYYLVLDCLTNCKNHRDLTISIGLGFVLLTVPISIFHSFEHWVNFRRPELQSQVIRIIWLVRCILS